METLIGFAVGFLVGTQQGRDGLAKVRESFEAIRTSPEVHKLLVNSASVAGSAVRQVLSAGPGAALSGAMDALVRKATEPRQAA